MTLLESAADFMLDAHRIRFLLGAGFSPVKHPLRFENLSPHEQHLRTVCG